MTSTPKMTMLQIEGSPADPGRCGLKLLAPSLPGRVEVGSPADPGRCGLIAKTVVFERLKWEETQEKNSP